MSLNLRAVGRTLSAADTIALAAETGFAGVDLLVRDLVETGEDPRRLRARMDDLGLHAGAFPLPMNWRGDADAFRADLAALDRYAEAAAVLGYARTATWVMPSLPDGVTREEAVEFHRERLGAIARVLDRHGIRLGLEVIGVASFRAPGRPVFVARMADLDPVLGAVWNDAPNLGVLVDAFHLYAAGEPPEAGLAWGVERVVWVHVADLPAGASPDRSLIHDPDRGLPGEHGAVECRALLSLLAERGYDGPVTAEPMADCRSLRGRTPHEAARDVRAALRSVWPSD